MSHDASPRRRRRRRRHRRSGAPHEGYDRATCPDRAWLRHAIPLRGDGWIDRRPLSVPVARSATAAVGA